MEMLFYKQPEIFDDYCQVFDEKLVTVKKNSKIYINFYLGKKVLSGIYYDRIN